WTHGAPGIEREGFPEGETKEHVVERLGRAIDRARAAGEERVLIFGHGHALRVLSMLWLGAPVKLAASFPLLTGSLSVLGWEKDSPAIVRWNS
ncbi:MAG TPA: histidine phosphatase family protein, partial [Arachnia sp.]|nr:histidine phosphatase family protein [Arachnia sp.]